MNYFTSDLHVQHRNILNWSKMRHSWKDTSEMSARLIDAWNSVVVEDDDVYNLGDLAFQVNNKFNDINIFLNSLHGNHHLLKGNHDYHKKLYEFQNIKSISENLFIELEDSYGKVKFFMAHYPYKHAMKEKDLTERPDSYVQYRYESKDKVFPLLCGHVHDSWMLRKDCLNVGFDAHGKLLSELDIMRIYRDTNGFQENIDKYDI